MMCAKFAYDSPSMRPVPRFRFYRKAKRIDMEDAKLALDIIIRPSLQLWKLALGRGALGVFKRPQKTMILRDDTTSTSSIPSKKRVRFDEQPVTISRRGFFDRYRKDSNSSPARPCLVIRLQDDVCPEPPELLRETDNHSVYEDCLSDHPGFLADLHVLEGNARSGTRQLKDIRRSEFYETDSGIATFDRAGYANYCLTRWLDKQREEARVPKNLAFKESALLPWRNYTLSPPSFNAPGVVCSGPPPPLPSHVRRPPRSLPRRIWNYVEDELQNAIVVLVVGSLIHTCLFAYLLYDILTRGLIPSDD